MGTNYYAIPKITDEVKLELIQHVLNDEFEEVFDKMSIRYHIGKSSAGWTFLFNKTPLILNNIELGVGNYIDFLQDCYIENEYGESLTIDEFAEKLRATKDGLTCKSFKELEGVPDIGNCEEFIIEGFRWSKSAEFS